MENSSSYLRNRISYTFSSIIFSIIATAINLVKDCGIILHNNSLRIIFNSKGQTFFLPCYVINLPKKYAGWYVEAKQDSTEEDGPEEMIEVRICKQ